METALAANGYATAARSTATPRGVEYQVFARITRELSDAGSLAKNQFPKVVSAVHENLRLWTVIAADVARENNALPADLRSKIFYLAAFTRHHSNKVLNGDEKGLDVLVDINKSIMRGLRSNAGATEQD